MEEEFDDYRQEEIPKIEWTPEMFEELNYGRGREDDEELLDKLHEAQS